MSPRPTRRSVGKITSRTADGRRTRASPKVSRFDVDRSFDPQIGNVDVPRLAPECVARVRTASFLCLVSSTMWKREDFIALPDPAEQRREVDEVLGNRVNDLTLSLHITATPDHVRRENEPALPLVHRGNLAGYFFHPLC